jgi:hypothetical protein
MSNIFKASRTNSSVPVVSRSNLFKTSPIIKPSFKFNGSEFPDLNDINKEKNLIIHDGYMSAFQKELFIDVKKLEPGCIMYTQGNNNEINIDYGDMKDRLNNEHNENMDNEVNKEKFKLIANNAFINIIRKWEKYRSYYIELYEEDTYNKLYRMKLSYDDYEDEDEDEYKDNNDYNDEYDEDNGDYYNYYY